VFIAEQPNRRGAKAMAILPPGLTGPHFGQINYAFYRTDMFGFLTVLAEHYGDVVAFDLGDMRCILVNGADEVRRLFFEHEECLRKPEFVKASNRGHWGDGLTTLEGSAWRTRRAVLRSSFRAGPVSSRLHVVAECTADMLNAWAPHSDVDLFQQLRILTARIAARVVLDAELEGYGPYEGRSGTLPFAEAYGQDYTSMRVGDPAAPLAIVRPRAPPRMEVALHIIAQRMSGEEKRDDVLTELIRARFPDGGSLTQDEILGEVIQMLYAGHLTIPFSLINFWREIEANGMAEKIASEGDNICANGVPEPAALSRSYCLAALKESMRLHPPAPILYREVERAFELGGYEFVPDVAVWVSPQLLHLDARYFPEPHRFCPERFLSEGLTGASGFIYLPFGAGRRVCIAKHYALHQMALISFLVARRLRSQGLGFDEFNRRVLS
jgi:cytochrome P450